MRSLPLILLVVLLIGLWLIRRKGTEGFTSSSDLITGNQDRMNPLASQQNPLENPAVPIGVPEAQAGTFRNMMSTALNIPTMMANGLGSFTFGQPQDAVTPRIDMDPSFLGMVKFCKEGGSSENPFTDQKFAANCGVCMSSGTLITGETFNTPTGVLVYDKDKDVALAKQGSGKFPFPRVIPSLKAATCEGASVDENAQPVLAITESDYNRFKKRAQCMSEKNFGKGCAMCVSEKNFSYVDPDDGTQPVNLYLFGLGKAIVRLSGVQKGAPILLSESTASVVPLERAREGSQLQIEVNTDVLEPPPANATPQQIAQAAQRTNPVLAAGGPFIYGYQESLTPRDRPYKLPIDKFIERDTLTGSTPRKLTSKYFAAPANLFLAKIVSKPNGDRMVLEGTLPLTFVESDALAAYDCPNSPFVSTQGHAELLVDDACFVPRGQKPGTYTDTCMRQKLIDAGCTSAGSWYSNLPAQSELLSILPKIMETVNTNPDHSMGCIGRQTSTPCDAYIGNGQIPNEACMTYLYRNGGENNVRVGRTYTSAPFQYLSFNKPARSIQFCQPEGQLNPTKPDGMAELTRAAGGYKGVQGLEAVKQYLSDVFTKATGNLDVNKPDSEGGKQTSWQKCLGIPIADVAVPVLRTQTQTAAPAAAVAAVAAAPAAPVVAPAAAPAPAAAVAAAPAPATQATVTTSAPVQSSVKISRRMEEYDYFYSIRLFTDALQKLSPATLGYPIRKDTMGDQNKSVYWGLSLCSSPESIQTYSLDDGYAWTVIRTFIGCLSRTGGPIYEWIRELLLRSVPNPQAGVSGNFFLAKPDSFMAYFYTAVTYVNVVLDNVNTLITNNFDKVSLGDKVFAVYTQARSVGISQANLQSVIPRLFESNAGTFNEGAFITKFIEYVKALPKTEKPQTIESPSFIATIRQGINI